MFKRFLAAIKQWLSSAQSSQDLLSTQDSIVLSKRRGFLRKAAIGTVSVSGTAGMAKVVVDSTLRPDWQAAYLKDAHSGVQTLLEREYVVMSEQEKAEMLQIFIDSYPNQT